MCNASKIYLILFLIINPYNPPYVNAKGNFELLYNHFNCTKHDPKGYLVQLNCGLSKSVKRRTVSMEMQFTKDIKSFGLDLLVILLRTQGDDFVVLNLTKLNGCQFLSNKNQVPLIRLGRDMLDRYGNFPQQCPYRGGVLYYVRSFRLDLSMLPAFSFESDMRWSFSFLHERARLFSAAIDCRVHMRQSGGVVGRSIDDVF